MSRHLIYPHILTGISTVLHFLVDGLCLCTLYLMSPAYVRWDPIGIFITYNILAFLTQPITGHISDRMRQQHWTLLAGILFLTMGVATASVTLHSGHPTSILGMLPTAILLGLGNSFFHTWGGRQVAMKTHNDIKALGLFVSTGAFGLAIGAVFCSWPLLYSFLIALCVLAATYLAIDFKVDSNIGKRRDDCSDKSDELHFGKMTATLAIIILMLLVMLRSWVGEDFSTTIEKSDMLIIAIGAITMLGKMAGGWLCQWLGIVRAMVIVLVTVLVCLLFRENHHVLAMAGLFAINCTMPVTLYLANEVLKWHEGLAFGLLAAALMPGYMLAFI